MKALIIITLVLLVVAIVAFAIVICGLSRKADDFYTELELTKELVSDADRRSRANYTILASFQKMQDEIKDEVRELKSSSAKYDVEERRALYKELRAKHSIKETASLMDISMRTARRYEDYFIKIQSNYNG